MNRHFKKRSILIVVVFVIAIVGLAAVYRWQQIPDDVIAFTSTREGRPAIYLISPDSKYLQRLSLYDCCASQSVWNTAIGYLPFWLQPNQRIVRDEWPFWSPDGQKIIYETGRNLSVMNANGMNNQIIFAGNHPYYTTTSFDSAEIAFIEPLVEIHPGSTLYGLFINSRSQTRQISQEFVDILPMLSPDFERIAYVKEEQTLGDPIYQVCVTTVDNDDTHCLPTIATGIPIWSPDSQKIAFSCETSLCVLALDHYQTSIINLPPEILYIPNERFAVVWSPDGQKISFRGITQVGMGDEMPDIYVVDVDGTNLIRLTTHKESDSYQNWSPDSTQLVFASTRNGNWDLYIINADGTGLTRLTYDEGDDYQPSWRPTR